MTVMLKSLRVTADFDASGYARGGGTKVATDHAMIASGEQVGASLASADAALQKLPVGLARLSRTYVEGYREADKFATEVGRLARSMDQGTSADRAAMIYERIAKSFGMAASSADLLRDKHVQLAPVVDMVNAKLAAQAEIAMRAASSPHYMENVPVTQLLGMNARPKSARDSAGVFEEQARQQERLAAAAAELKRQIDPLAAAQDRLNAEMAEYNAMAAAGMLSTQQLTAAQSLAEGKYARTQEYIKHVGTGIRLTQHEVANLSYQFNDMAVMMASGQAPFMMLMQQGMQIGQIIGPQGLQGGIRALGSGIMAFLTNPVNLAVIGFASLAGVASMFFSSAKEEQKKVNTLLETQNDLLREAREVYGDIVKVLPESARILDFKIRLNDQSVRDSIRTQFEGILEGIRPFETVIDEFGTATQQLDLASPFLALQDPLEKALRGIKSGTLDVEGFREELVSIAKANPYLESTVNQIVSLLAPLDAAERKANALGAAFRKTRQMIESESMAALLGFASEGQINADRIRRGAALEIQGMSATSPQEKANIAAEQERLSLLNEQIHPLEAAARIEAARSVALAQANRDIEEQNRQLRERAAEEEKQRAEQLKQEGQQVWEKTRTSLEKYQIEIRRLNDLLTEGVIDHETYARAVTQLGESFARTTEPANEFRRALEGAGGDIVDGFTESLVGMARGTMNLGDAWRNAANSIITSLQDIGSQLVKTGLMSLLMGSNTIAPSQAGGGLIGNILSMFGFANGGVFANSVVSQPTMFAYGSGNVGIMGEAGPEAIMPLRRGADGRLGVAAAGQGGGTVVNFAPQTTIDARGADAGVERRLMAAIEASNRRLAQQVPALVIDGKRRSKLA